MTVQPFSGWVSILIWLIFKTASLHLSSVCQFHDYLKVLFNSHSYHTKTDKIKWNNLIWYFVLSHVECMLLNVRAWAAKLAVNLFKCAPAFCHPLPSIPSLLCSIFKQRNEIKQPMPMTNKILICSRCVLPQKAHLITLGYDALMKCSKCINNV